MAISELSLERQMEVSQVERKGGRKETILPHDGSDGAWGEGCGGAAGTGGCKANERGCPGLQADEMSPEPGQTKRVGEEGVDSRNIQEVAGGSRDFLDVGGEAEGEGSVYVFDVTMGVNAERRPSCSESGYFSPARFSRSPQKGEPGTSS